MRKKYEQKICPYCHAPIGPEDTIAVCNNCDMPHHLSCWQENMRCTTFGCTGRIKAILQPEMIDIPPAPRPVPAAPAAQPAPAAPAPQTARAAQPAPQAAPVAQRFDILQQSENFSVQDGCPVIVINTTLLRGSVNGQLLVRCTMQSLAETPIVAMMLDLQCKDVWGNTVEGITGYQYLDLKAKKGTLFGQNTPIALPNENTRSVTVTIRKISYADGRLDDCQAPAQEFPKPATLEEYLGDVNLANEFIRQIGSKAKFAPVSQSGIWRCTCGAMHTEQEQQCQFCGSEAAVLLSKLDREQLEADMLAFRQAEEERIMREKAEREARLAKARAEEEERIRQKEEAERIAREKREAERQALLKKKRKRRKIIITVTSLIATICLLVFLVIPYGIFLYADKQLAAGEYDQAYKLFSTLQDFNGSAEKANLSRYQKAEKLLEQEQFDDAHDLYVALGSYKDSATKAQESLYRKAAHLIDTEAYSEALEIYLQLGAYADSPEKAKEAKFLRDNVENERQYKEANALLSQNDYDKALEIFVSLGEYKDSRDKAKQCQYHQADALLQEGKYDEAAAIFGSLGDFQDAPDKYKEAQYNKAVILLNEGNYTAAANLFNMIPGYKDVDTLVLELNYRVGNDLYESGKYKEAAEYFKLAGDYSDAQKMAQKASYKYGKQLMTDGNYEEAVKVFTDLGKYEDSATMVKKAKYEIACNELDAGNYASAIAKFTELGSYKDSADKVKEAKYQQARGMEKKNNYADAYKLYKELGKYEDSKTRLDNLVNNWAEDILKDMNKTNAQKFHKTVSLTSDQQADVYTLIWNKIQANPTFNYWDDTWQYTTRSAVVYEMLQTISSSHKDNKNLLTLFKALSDGSIHPVGTFIRNNNKLLENLWKVDFVKDFLQSDDMISYFLEGYWETSSGSYYMKFYESSGGGTSSSFNLPWVEKPYGTMYYDIEDLIYYWDDDNSNHLAKVFRFEIVSFNKIKVYCYKNNQTYTVYRE